MTKPVESEVVQAVSPGRVATCYSCTNRFVDASHVPEGRVAMVTFCQGPELGSRAARAGLGLFQNRTHTVEGYALTI